MAHHTRTPVLAPFPGPPSPSPKTRAPPPRALFTNCTFFAQFRLPPPLPTPIHPKDGRRRGIVSPRHTTNPFSPSPFSLSLSLPHARARALSVRSKGFSTDLAPHRSRLLASYVRTIVLYYTISRPLYACPSPSRLESVHLLSFAHRCSSSRALKTPSHRRLRRRHPRSSIPIHTFVPLTQ